MSNVYINVKKYSHNFVCIAISPKGNEICESFARKFLQWGVKHERGRFLKKVLKIYATKTNDSVEYRFHINSFKDFIDHIKLMNVENQVYIEDVKIPSVKEIDMKVKDIFKPRDNQLSMIDYLSNVNNKNKLLSAQTGSGKSIMSLFSISNLNRITAIIVRPQFMTKWRDDIIDKCEVSKDEIMMVQGTPHLLKLLEHAKYNNLDCKFIIISNKTLQVWFKQYEKYRDEIYDFGYECLPHEMYTLLNVGIRLVDEVHMDLHLQCKIDLYTHVEHSISLSATLLSNDPFIRKMQELMYPLYDRFKVDGLDKYIDTFNVTYALESMDGIRTNEFGSPNYSHTAYEKSIIKYRPRLMKYLNMVDWLIKESYFKVERKKKKLLVYAGSIMMCTIMTNYFKEKYPSLDIRRYVEDDDYENLLEPDIRFTTLISSGVGHDIADLTTVIMTTAIQSIQSNIQALGRLRKLSDDSPVEFYWLTCKDIPKHIQYSQDKEKLMSERAKSYRLLQSGFRV